MGIFHAYDIRGVYEKDITVDTMIQVALLLADELKPKKAMIGYDPRNGSERIANAMADALLDCGVDVLFVGLVTTPMLYFGVNKHECDLGIMVTASHNPREYVGAKFVQEKAQRFGYSQGLDKIEARMDETIMPPENSQKGNIKEINLTEDYTKLIVPYASAVENLKIAIDTSSGATSIIIKEILKNMNVEPVLINDEPNGDFPAHTPNPLDAQALTQIEEVTRSTQSDIGMMFDADGDRIEFCDENGKAIPADIIGMLISEQLLKENPGQTIFYDVRTTKDFPKLVTELGGIPKKVRVGHSFIHRAMQKNNGLFASEISGHFFFRNFYYCENPLFAMFLVLQILTNEPRSLSEIVAEYTKHFKSDEINMPVPDVSAAIAKIKKEFSDAKLDKTDGITIEYPNWWVNVRPSNTEPLLRINLEADSAKVRDEKLSQVKNLLSSS